MGITRVRKKNLNADARNVHDFLSFSLFFCPSSQLHTREFVCTRVYVDTRGEAQAAMSDDFLGRRSEYVM